MTEWVGLKSAQWNVNLPKNNQQLSEKTKETLRERLRKQTKGFALGDEVIFTGFLKKTWPKKNQLRYRVVNVHPKMGVIVGHRVGYEGNTFAEFFVLTEYTNDDLHSKTYKYFKRIGSVPHLLIATSMKKAHYRVPYELVSLSGERE